jgi:ABC-2 type transport system ATP-binding protein
LRRLSRTAVSARTDRPAVGLSALPGVHDVELDGGRVSFTVDADALGAAMGVLVEHGLRTVTSHPPTLEELFLREYSDVVAGERARSARGRAEAADAVETAHTVETGPDR